MSDKQLEEYVDEDIKEFERFFCEHVDVNAIVLMPQEKAIIKTFIWWATHPGEVPRGKETGSGNQV